MAYKILLADDSVTIQKVVELTFADSDFTVTSVSDGLAALRKIKEIKPNIILLDIFMPQLDGYQVCEKVKKDPALKETPVLLLTGTFESFDEDKAAQVQADGFITKPFESTELISRVQDLIQIETESEVVDDTEADVSPEPAIAEVADTEPEFEAEPQGEESDPFEETGFDKTESQEEETPDIEETAVDQSDDDEPIFDADEVEDVEEPVFDAEPTDEAEEEPIFEAVQEEEEEEETPVFEVDETPAESEEEPEFDAPEISDESEPVFESVPETTEIADEPDQEISFDTKEDDQPSLSSEEEEIFGSHEDELTLSAEEEETDEDVLWEMPDEDSSEPIFESDEDTDSGIETEDSQVTDPLFETSEPEVGSDLQAVEENLWEDADQSETTPSDAPDPETKTPEEISWGDDTETSPDDQSPVVDTEEPVTSSDVDLGEGEISFDDGSVEPESKSLDEPVFESAPGGIDPLPEVSQNEEEDSDQENIMFDTGSETEETPEFEEAAPESDMEENVQSETDSMESEPEFEEAADQEPLFDEAPQEDEPIEVEVSEPEPEAELESESEDTVSFTSAGSEEAPQEESEELSADVEETPERSPGIASGESVVPTAEMGEKLDKILLDNIDQIIERVTDKLADKLSHSVAERLLQKIELGDVPEKAKKYIEEIAWEVVPDLADVIIKKEIDQIKAQLS